MHNYYRISSYQGPELYMGQATSIEEALNDYAKDAGYSSYHDLVRSLMYYDEFDADPDKAIADSLEGLVIERAKIDPVNSEWVRI